MLEINRICPFVPEYGPDMHQEVQWEPKLPIECQTCVRDALIDPYIERDEHFFLTEPLNGEGSLIDTNEADGWHIIGMQSGIDANRIGILEVGIDVDGQSYSSSSQTSETIATFDCHRK